MSGIDQPTQRFLMLLVGRHEGHFAGKLSASAVSKGFSLGDFVGRNLT